MAGQPGQQKHNWAAAFLAFTKGKTLDEISVIFQIPRKTLEWRHAHERWPSLSKRITAEVLNGQENVQALEKQTEKRLAIIEENRRKNFEMFDKLRQDFQKVVEALLEDRLTVEKSWCNKDGIQTHEAQLSTGDRVNLATYARTIAEGSYAALGDRVSGYGAKDGGGDGAPPPPAVTIILPGAIAAPRAERDITPKGTVLDLRPESVQILDAQPSPEPEPCRVQTPKAQSETQEPASS